MKLRDYQEDAVNAALSTEGNALLVCPTGSGKSILIAGIIDKVLSAVPDANIVICQHRKELVEQNFDKFTKVCPEHLLKAGIYSASVGQKNIKQITFAQIQSIYDKEKSLPPIQVLLVDECHLINSSDTGMFRSFIAALKLRNPNLFIIGLTATPFRMTTGMIMQGENALFDDITYDIGMTELISKGYLCKLKSKYGQVQANLKEARIRHGEYRLDDMEEAISPLTEAACEEIVTYGAGRKHWLLFCTSVKHANDVARCLTTRGFPATSIDGSTKKSDRERLFREFESGKIRALTNCEIATTGYDFPGIDLIALLRGTKSPGLFVQMCGRGLRIAPSKENCLVLDYAGNIERFGCIDNIKVRKTRNGFQLATKPVKKCPQCGNALPINYRNCECGYVFERAAAPHETEASELPIISQEMWVGVNHTSFKVHNKPGKPPSLKVTYECENNILVREFLCFEHGGYPTKKAHQWWRKNADEKIPTGTEEAFHSVTKVKPVSEIKIVPEGDKWFKVLDRKHGNPAPLIDALEEIGINI